MLFKKNWAHLHTVTIPYFTSYDFAVCTVKDKNLCTIACFWSKTTLIASSVCEIGVNPPLRKINTFCLRSLALSVPIYRHFQSNGDNWRSIKR